MVKKKIGILTLKKTFVFLAVCVMVAGFMFIVFYDALKHQKRANEVFDNGINGNERGGLINPAENSYGITPFAGQPLAITSAGASNDSALVQGLANRQGLENRYVLQMTSLEGCSTLILVTGGSMKGLSFIGSDPESEKERVKNLISEAQAAGMSIITIHMGGSARRGALSDKFNRLSAENAHLIIIAGEGDQDGFFSNIAEENCIPIVKVTDMQEAAGPLFEAVISEDNQSTGATNPPETVRERAIRPFAQQPLAITTAGASPDGAILKSITRELGLEYNYELLMSSLDGSNTLVLVPGGSIKGMSAMGSDMEKEKTRVQGLIQEAKNTGASIITIHTGGIGRRGELSDIFNRLAASNSDLIIVAGSGDHDGFFTGLARELDIPIAITDNIHGIAKPLSGAVFKEGGASMFDSTPGLFLCQSPTISEERAGVREKIKR